MMINGSEKMKLIGALLEKLCLTASASFPTSAMLPFTSFFIFFRFVMYTYVRTVVCTASYLFLFYGCVHNLSAQQQIFFIGNTQLEYLRARIEQK